MVRAIQPHILFNGRNGLPGDFGTPGRWPGSTLAFAGLECRLRGVTLLGSNLPVRFTQSGGRVLLTGLPDDPPDPVCPVLRFDFDRPPSVYLTGGLRTPRVPHPHYDPCPSDLMHGTDGPAFHTASASTQGEPTMTTSLAAAHSAKVKLAGVTVHLGEPMQAAESIGRVWFPTTAQFPTGELLLTYSLSADTNENHIDLSGYQVSADGGRSWTPRYDVVPEHQPMIYLPQADGALFAIPAYLYAVDPKDRHSFYGSALRFEQAGRRVVFEPQGVRLVDWPWPVNLLPNPQLSPRPRVNLCFDGDALSVDGRLLATLYGAKGDDPLYSVIVAASEDGGRMWRYLSTAAGPECVPAREPRGHGPGEPSLVQLANGDLMIVMRMGGGADFPLRRCYSADGGRTWSAPDILPACSVEPSLKRLRDGTILLSTGRPGIYLWVAGDARGRTWESIDLLAHHNRWAPHDGFRIAPGQTTSYTELIEVAPNRLILVYDRTPFGWHPIPADSGERNRIFVLPIEVTAD